MAWPKCDCGVGTAAAAAIAAKAPNTKNRCIEIDDLIFWRRRSIGHCCRLPLGGAAHGQGTLQCWRATGRIDNVKSYAAIVILAAAVLCVAQTKSKSVWDGVYTADQAKRGEERYGRQCGHCHGDDLEGDIVENPQLAGPMFRDKWNGLNLGQL